MKEKINDLEENIITKDEINLIYNTEKEGECKIFGDKFVEINKNNIDLNINGKSSKLVSKYKLKKGNNNIKIIIKNKLTDLQYMFWGCSKLKNINELKNLNTQYCNNFQSMFEGCSSLLEIKGLEEWNVSNGNNFKGMFQGCSSLTDIK